MEFTPFSMEIRLMTQCVVSQVVFMMDVLPYQIHLSYVHERSPTDSGNQQKSSLNLTWTLPRKPNTDFKSCLLTENISMQLC